MAEFVSPSRLSKALEQVAAIYIKALSVSGQAMTVTKGDGTTSELTLPSGGSYDTGTETTAGITKLYSGTGTAADGAMTQAAATTAISEVDTKLDNLFTTVHTW